ncbi:MAG: MotA/TolQ/ExbB proton channel family protein [Gammaproteobacteria bacterium]
MDHTLNFSETVIVDGTLWLLACFSLFTWSVIFLKAGELLWQHYRLRRLMPRIIFPEWIDVSSDSAPIKAKELKTPIGRLWQLGRHTYGQARGQPQKTLQQSAAWHELIERAFRQQLQKERAVFDSGLGWLASIGTTAPFVGLFGTVWGIMHALKDISKQGDASLEVVAGPIGEALIATAVGLAVAIPAVIAYNFFLRQNRMLLARLEHFATDFLRACIQNDLIDAYRENDHVHATAR